MVDRPRFELGSLCLRGRTSPSKFTIHWNGCQDSNLKRQSQSLLCYQLHHTGSKIKSRTTTFTHLGLCWPRTGVGPRCCLLALELNLLQQCHHRYWHHSPGLTSSSRTRYVTWDTGPDSTPPCTRIFRSVGHRTRHLLLVQSFEETALACLSLANTTTKLGAAKGVEPLRESRMRRTGRLPNHYCIKTWSGWLDSNQRSPDSKSGMLTRLHHTQLYFLKDIQNRLMAK